ncbi:papilin-like isoform X2 [Mytilus trossulus]|uniref:papilin-like isoform X2 n=1 Tax=Mytilus trossulus TaxID=6551 RepID=UPI003006ACB0
MMRQVIVLCLIQAVLAKEITGCTNAEKTSDGTKNKTCWTNDQCSDDHFCVTHLMLCCPILQLPKPVLVVEPNILPKTDPEPNDICNYPEKDTNGLKKACSKTNTTCSKNYLCMMGTCCLDGSKLNFVPVPLTKSSSSCPSVENMPVGLCFDIQDSIRCGKDQVCQGEQLCCPSGCGSVCTNPEKPLKPCQKQLRMAALQLFAQRENEICSAIFLPRCDSDGQFQKKQCLDSHGICWCVHSNGTKIKDSDVRGNPDCSKATRAGSCPSPDQWTMMDLLDDGCKSDDNCSGPDDKCCFNGLGNQCVPPDGMLTTERDRRSLPTPGCSNGKMMKCCAIDLCLHAVCPNNPQAVCRINPCNDCSTEFYDQINRKVDSCFDGGAGIGDDMFQSKRGDFVCPVILPTTAGICQQECNSDTDCVSSKMCCYNGCANTCQNPVQVMSDEVCKLPPISGECISKQYVNRTYFNQATGKCETFRYRDGCHGNGNNFLSNEACVRGCIPGIPDLCLSNPDPGMCEGYFPMWSYNVTSNRCEQFVYGGCDGNRNKFSTEKQCYMSCGTSLNLPSVCQKLSCQENAVCLAYNETYGECLMKTDILPELHYYVADCDASDGSFIAEQCAGTVCWCVDVQSGTYIKDTMRIGRAQCNTSDANNLTDSHKPVCSNGNIPSPCIGACGKSTCRGNPSAICVPDPCNNCSIHFENDQGEPVVCGMDKCKSHKPDHSDHQEHVGEFACGNPVMRYVYNIFTFKCESFLYTKCEGPDVYFRSVFDCQDQCTGSMCENSQPKTCDNTCASMTCPYLTGALCQVNLCTCQPEFYDPVTMEKVSCNKVYPVCQQQRSLVHNWMVKSIKGADNSKRWKQLPVCDEKGDFIPQQCFKKLCWCVDGIGNTIHNSQKVLSNSYQSIDCMKNITTAATITFSFLEDYDMYAKNKEEKVKSLISDALRKLSPDFSRILKRVTVQRGSIKVGVELEASSSEEFPQVASHANLLESQIRDGFTVDMDGKLMTANKESVETTLNFEPQESPDKATKLDGGTISMRTIIIIIIVVCAVICLLFIIIMICAKRRSSRSKEADLMTVENVHQPNSCYFKNEACDLKDEQGGDKKDEKS